MHIHNFLVDNINCSKSNSGDDTFERSMFIDDMCDNDIFNIIVGNDNNRGDGWRPRNDERTRRHHGLELRYKLKQSLANHNMQRKTKGDAWQYGSSNHVQMVNEEYIFKLRCHFRVTLLYP